MCYVNPAPLKLNQFQTPEMDRLYRMILTFLKFPKQYFHEWSVRPECGYFFTGCHWYGADQNEMAMLLAFAVKCGKYDETLTGFSCQEAQEMAVKVLRYAAFTHDTGPEDCVRVDGKNRMQAKTKWGGNVIAWPGPRSIFFQGTQVGTGLSNFGLAAWLLWEDLDEETRQMAYNVITDYAERWAEYEPRDGVYYNTQAEENGWTSLGIHTAAAIFPQDPRADKWRKGAIRWMLDSGNVPLDMVSDETLSDGTPLRQMIDHITLHPDYTTENHAIVHPDYLGAVMDFRSRILIFTLLAGTEELPGLRHNWEQIYEGFFTFCASDDGGAVPIQSQDWWYHKINSFIYIHTASRLLFDNPQAAYLEEKCISTFEHTQAGHENGTFVDNEPEKCIISQDFQTLTDVEPYTCSGLVYSYLLHMCMGKGVNPVSAEEFEAQTDGVRHFPFGGSVVHRTKKALSAFSYRNSALAFTLPEDSTWLVTAAPCSTFGEMLFTSGCEKNLGWSNQTVIRQMHNIRVYDDQDTYAVSASIDRGLGQVEQKVSVVSLPGGNTVYFQRVTANEDCTIEKFTSGLVGIRNEYYKFLPSRAKGYRLLSVNDNAPEKMEGYIGGEDVAHDYENVKYVSVDDKISYLLSGSNRVRYLSHHNYPKWKGVEDFITLNLYEHVTLKAGEEIPRFVMVSLPNQGVASARNAYENFRVSKEGYSADAVILGNVLVYSSYAKTQGVVSAAFDLQVSRVPLFAGQVHFKNGEYVWSTKILPGGCGYCNACGSVSSEKNFDALVLENGTVLIRYEDESVYRSL